VTSEPLPAENVDVNVQQEEEDDFTIGEGSIGDGLAGAQADTQAGTQGDTQTGTQTTNVTTEEVDTEDIPDWLKEEKIDEPEDVDKSVPAVQSQELSAQKPAEDTSSTPMGPSGKVIDLNTVEEQSQKQKGADPYSDYGLASKDNDG
jgi:hypothetical protein